MDIAVITGASSGIGKQFLGFIDKLGLDEIWAIALEQDKLDELKNEFTTPIKPLAMDLTNAKHIDKYVKLLGEVKPNVKWLLNASGFGKFGRYDEIPVEQSANMVDLNCKALLCMTEYTLPYMTKGGRIVQIASVAGWQPIPYIATYGATKAFVVSYGRALNRELKSKGISVTTICPFWTKTAFFKRAEDTSAGSQVVTKYTALYDPEFVAKSAFKAAIKRKELHVVGFKAKLQCFGVKVLPHSLVMKVWINQQKLNKKYKDK